MDVSLHMQEHITFGFQIRENMFTVLIYCILYYSKGFDNVNAIDLYYNKIIKKIN